MKKFSFLLFAVVIGLCFFATNSFARVTLNAAAVKATVPADRNEKIGPALDGIVSLDAGSITWTMGQNYVSGNRLKMWISGGTGLEFAGTWKAISNNAGSTNTVGMNVNSIDVFALQLDTVADAASGILVANSGVGTLDLHVNVSGISGEQLFNINGVCLTSGAGTVDGQDSDPLLETITQYSAAVKGTAKTTIDVVNTDGKIFVGSTIIASAYTFDIDSTNIFLANTWHCPAFSIAGGNTDALQLVLEGTDAFQGISTVVFIGGVGAQKQTVTVPTAVKANAYQKWTTNYRPVGIFSLVGSATVGPNGVPVNFAVQLISDVSTALKVRKIDVKGDLSLNATGNGDIVSANFPNRIQFVQNGAQYASNMFKTTESGSKAFFKFANMSNSDIPLEVRYYPGTNDSTNVASGWVTYTGDGGNGIPAGQQIVITTAEAASVLGFAANTYDGLIIFRAKGAPGNITAMVNCVNANGSFNAPLLQYDPAANREWMY